MRDRFLAAWRTAVQAFLPLLIAVLANHGIRIPATAAGWAQTALIGAGAGVWAWGTHWLQTRTGNTPWARAARFAGRVLMLGGKALPTYPAAASPAATVPAVAK